MTSRAAPAALVALALAACSAKGRPPSLAEPVAVAQPGGFATQIFAQGTVMPTSATEAFTTSKDDDKKLYVQIVRGAGRQVDKLSSEGFWAIDGVTGGPAGTPKVLVTFDLDAQGHLALSARQEARKLAIKKVEGSTDKLKPSRLLEPDDEDDAIEEE